MIKYAAAAALTIGLSISPAAFAATAPGKAMATCTAGAKSGKPITAAVVTDCYNSFGSTKYKCSKGTALLIISLGGKNYVLRAGAKADIPTTAQYSFTRLANDCSVMK